MRVAVFSTKRYDREFLDSANQQQHELVYLEARLTEQTAAAASGAEVVCAFVNDDLSAKVLSTLHLLGTKLIALRCAGFNNVDLEAARRLGIIVSRVPEYSPFAVAEHTVALMLSLNRKVHRAYSRIREGNFALDGLMGFDLHGRTVGIIGTGRIGRVVTQIMNGFGCRILAVDPSPSETCRKLGATYVDLSTLLSEADIITLHCPLTPDTFHLVNDDAVARIQQGAMIINTSRGAVIETRAIIAGLKSGRIGALGLDVYEEEAELFYENLSERAIQDDVFARLLTFPNVLITGHQGFFTTEAMAAIAQRTIANINEWLTTGRVLHEVSIERLV